MHHHTGSIEVITGSMFSGKTDEMIRRLRRATIATQKVQVFKPLLDFRFGLEKVTSHAGANYTAKPIEKITDLESNLDADTTVIAIDEAQFFGPEIVEVAQKLANHGKRVIEAGRATAFPGANAWALRTNCQAFAVTALQCCNAYKIWAALPG